MSKKSIEDVMNEIEDFLNSCKTSALSSNKIVVPRDEFDELFGDLRVKIPAEIDRCKKIMRSKEAILMEARKSADNIIHQASVQASHMVSETEIMNMANQQAYETVEIAKEQAADILNQAVEEANQIRLGSMQYTNDIMTGLRDYMMATMEAERANYENLITALNNEYTTANANLNEVQKQIMEYTGDPTVLQTAPQFKNSAESKNGNGTSKTKPSMMQKMKQAVGGKEDKNADVKPTVNIPDFVASGDKVVPNETPLRSVKQQSAIDLKGDNSKESDFSGVLDKQESNVLNSPIASVSEVSNVGNIEVDTNADMSKEQSKVMEPASLDGFEKTKKKIIKRRNPVIQTPQTAQETVAKTLEAASASKVDKTVYKANGEQARDASSLEGRVKRSVRMGRNSMDDDNGFEVTTQSLDSVSSAQQGKSMGVVDDFAMEPKY